VPCEGVSGVLHDGGECPHADCAWAHSTPGDWGEKKTHHGVLSEGTDLLDGTRSTLLEANTVALYRKRRYNQSSVRMPSGRDAALR
jgi:hypothetical protein